MTVIKAHTKHAGGRPRGVTMPCGWGCGRELTAAEMRKHFTVCSSRPDRLGTCPVRSGKRQPRFLSYALRQR